MASHAAIQVPERHEANSFVNVSYSSWKSAVLNDATTTNDTTFVNTLPTGSSFSLYMNHTSNNGNSATPYVDNTGSNTTQVQMTTANARALGFSPSGTDATITFSSLFSWDFDNRDGIDSGKQDFVGVAIHEIMHSMGFVSNVDDVDFSSNLTDDSYRAAGLDFTRFSINSLAAGANIDFTADTRAKFFSIDGGATNLTPGASGGWSTGVNFGDGRQASHWKDGLGWGIMDPTAQPAGNLNVVTNLDLMALDVIGWNRITAVPEPSAMLLFVVSLLGLSCFRRNSVPMCLA
ncbi:MAG: NF038122 family metalloprotease [Pirellulales bacterium]